MPQPPRTPSDAGQNLATSLFLLGELQPALRRGDRAKQNEIVEKLVEMRAPMGDQWPALANVALQNGEITLARKAIDRFVEESGGAPLAQYHKTAVLEQSGAMSDAYALLSSLPRDMPDAVTNAYSRGVAALFLGNDDEARGQLERAARLQPRLGAAWLALATSADMASEPDLADRIAAAESEMADAEPAHRAPYYYALGKVHADRGEHGLAFTAFARGAQEMKSLVPYSPQADQRNAAGSLDGYSGDSIAALSRPRSGTTANSIFVTGSPRSGTSLVEQILTSHSAVSDGGETNRLLLLAREVGGHSWPALKGYVDSHGVAKAADLWRHWMDERFPAPGRVVDKSLTTTRLIGLAAALLPDAPLIWLTRDPLDCAWSCFRTFFQGSMPWSHDLADIARHFRIEDELLQRWQEILGERLLVVPYESMVAEPEAWIRRIMSHCGLAEEPQVFAPQENARNVRTASLMQVRRPINRRAIGSAEPYREFLEPFISAYYS